MPETIETTGQILGAASGRLSDAQIRILDNSPAMAALRAAMVLVPSKALADLSQGIADVMRDALNIPLGDILKSGWNTGRDLHAYRDADKYPADAVFEHPLNEHTVSSTFHPTVEMLVNGVAVPHASMEFTITVALIIESAVVRIRNARIIGATIGQCQGKGTLKCGDTTLTECLTREFALPTISFGDGVAIL